LTAALVALIALLLVPGLLAARAPLGFVPALSASFWIVSSWWLPASVGRERFVRAILVGGGVLALVRLREVPRRWPPFLVVALTAAAVLLAALAFVLRPPAESFSSISATLVVWNDGIPSGYEPLLDLSPFGADAPALATLAADVALLSGLAPRPAMLLAGLSASYLLCLGVLEMRPARAAARHGVALALLGVATAFLVQLDFRTAPAVFAVALAISSFGVLRGGDSLSRSLAAGLTLSASLLSQSLVGLVAFVALGLVLRPWAFPLHRNRAIVALGLALVLAAPQIQRLGSAISVRELHFVGFRSPPCPNLPWIYQEEAVNSAHPCALTLFDKLLGNPDLSRTYY
jgi:hypothetical protein